MRRISVLVMALACAFAVPIFAADKESPNITVFRPAVNPRDPNDNMVQGRQGIQEANGREGHLRLFRLDQLAE